MRKKNYKGRCTKRYVAKCTDVCRTYDPLQTAYQFERLGRLADALGINTLDVTTADGASRAIDAAGKATASRTSIYVS